MRDSRAEHTGAPTTPTNAQDGGTPAGRASERRAAALAAWNAPAVPSVDAPPGMASEARFVVILGALSAFGPLSIDMYLPGLPSLARELGATASQVQLTLSGCLIGLALGQIVAGPLSDALGRRRPLLAGVAAYAIASLLCVVAPSALTLAVLRVVQGCAGAAGIVISRAIVRDLYTGVAAARFFSLLMLVNGLAPILAPIVGGQLLRVTTWRGIFVTLAVIGSVLVVAAATGVPETLPPGRRAPGSIGATLRTFGRLLGDRHFLGYALSAGLALAAMFTYISGSPFVLQRIYGVSPQLFSVAFGVNALGLMAAGQANRWLLRWMAPRRLLAAGLTATALGGIGLFGVVSLGSIGLAGVLPCLFAVVASLGFVLPNSTALALAGHPRTAGSASALLGVLQYSIGAAAAPLAGVAGATSALPMALVIAALDACALTAFLVLGRARPSTT